MGLTCLNAIPPGSFFLQSSRDLQFEALNTNAMDDLGCRKGVKEMPREDFAHFVRFNLFNLLIAGRIGRSSKKP